LPLVANATTIMKGVRSVIQRQRFPLDIMLNLLAAAQRDRALFEVLKVPREIV
jgi:hypothetical protein